MRIPELLSPLFRPLLRPLLRPWRKKDPNAEAAAIKAKFAAKLKPQGLFTPSQEELMAELGLTPGAKPEQVNSQKNSKAKKPKKFKDPLTKRQRQLAQELGLVNPNED